MGSLLTVMPVVARAQRGVPPDPGYDLHLAPAATLLALRNDLSLLQEALRIILPRPEYPGLEREAKGIRHDVRVLDDQVREHLEGRHDGPVGGTAVVNWLRQRVQRLRDDIDHLPRRKGDSPATPSF